MSATLLRAFGKDEEQVAETIAEVRLRDADRFALQRAGDLYAGRDPMVGNVAMAVETQARCRRRVRTNPPPPPVRHPIRPRG